MTASIYRTIDIARRAGIHVNTVRFYERIQLISPVPRNSNNYRAYSHRHLCQVLVLRFVFLNVWPGNAVRNASYTIVDAMKKWDIAQAKSRARDYLKTIEQEIDKAIAAIDIIKTWSDRTTLNKPSRKLGFHQTAELIGVSRETIRGWERNGLIRIPREGPNKTRYFTNLEIDRLQVIYLLRQARFSLSAIHKAVGLLDQGGTQKAADSLESPDMDFIFTTGDHVVDALRQTHLKAKELLHFLDTVPGKRYL